MPLSASDGLLDRGWIMAHIPHQGRMCLLHEVTAWDAERIVCRAINHRDADHPLRAQGRLGIWCGIEYAAQAMAVHGALTAGAVTRAVATPQAHAAGGTLTSGGAITPEASAPPPAPVAGFLAALRGVAAHVARLDDVPDGLVITAARMAGDHASALYEFELRSEVGCLLSGRATVVLDANGRLRS